MLFGLPTELVTMLGGGIFSGVMTMWAQAAKDKNEQFNRLIKAQEVQHSFIQDAAKTDKHFSFTKRVLAIGMFLVGAAVIFFPIISGAPTVIELTSETEGLFGLFKDKVTEYATVDGFVTPEWVSPTMSAVFGSYFTHSMIKR